MSLRINDIAPDFTAESTEGPISFHAWLGDRWGLIFSHPKDFTPVCTTELGYTARLKPEFDRRGVKVIGLSVDPVDKHQLWAKDIEETQGAAPNFPMIGDPTLAVSKLYDMLPADSGTTADGRTAADNQTVRTVYAIGPDKRIKASISYPMSTGRNFDEVLRVIDSLQLTARFKVSTPVNWKQGEDVIISGSVSNDEAKKVYPNGWREPKPYIRIVPQPVDAAKPGSVRLDKPGVATFDVPVERVFRYMSAGNHPHASIKTHKLIGSIGNTVSIDTEFYNPDGSTFRTTIRHQLNQPAGIVSTMSGGPFDGARFTHSYTPLADGKQTRVDLSGDFPPLPGISAQDELRMIDGMFTTFFAEDTATLRTWEG
jgi:alkyl hydroperoxide reductase subunit AhpC